MLRRSTNIKDFKIKHLMFLVAKKETFFKKNLVPALTKITP